MFEMEVRRNGGLKSSIASMMEMGSDWDGMHSTTVLRPVW